MTETSTSSLIKSTSNLVVACVGAGVLVFPEAMYDTGCIIGVIITVCFGLLNLCGMGVITRMSAPIVKGNPSYSECLTRYRETVPPQAVDENAHSNEHIFIPSYIDLMYIRLGKGYGDATKAIVIFGTLGTLVAFLIIIADLAEPVLDNYFEASSFFTSREFVTFTFVLFVVFPLSTLPNLEALSMSSVIAITTILFVCIVVIGESIGHSFGSHISSISVTPSSATSIFYAIPIILFAFVGILQVVPVMGEMGWDASGRTIKDMYTVCRWTVIFCAGLYLTIGLFGFIQFGSDTDAVILDNYGDGDDYANFGRLAMAVHVALAYPIILYPAQQYLLMFVFLPVYEKYMNGDGEGRSGNPEEATHNPTHSFSQNLSIAVDPIKSSFMVGSMCMRPSNQDRAEKGAAEAPVMLRMMSSLAITVSTATVALALPEAEVVFGFMGSIVGSSLVLIFPGLLILKYECDIDGMTEQAKLIKKITGNFFLGFGTIIAVGGTLLYLLEFF